MHETMERLVAANLAITATVTIESAVAVNGVEMMVLVVTLGTELYFHHSKDQKVEKSMRPEKVVSRRLFPFFTKTTIASLFFRHFLTSKRYKHSYSIKIDWESICQLILFKVCKFS